MKSSRLCLLLALLSSVAIWSSCDSGSPNGGRGTIGPGTTATYIVFTDGSQVKVESINPNGSLTPILGSPYTAGSQPTKIAVTPSGKFIYVLNAGSNSISQFRIATDGTLTKLTPDVLTGSQPVSIAIDAQERFAVVANKNAGNISIYRIDGTTGGLVEISVSPVPTGNTPLAVTTRNNFIYAIGSTSIADIAIDPVNFTIVTTNGSPFSAGPIGSLVGGTAGIQLYALDNVKDCGSGAVPILNCVDNYTLDINNGTPTLATSLTVGNDPQDVIQILAGRFLYVANKGSNSVSGFSIDGATGVLTPVAGSPFAVGTGTNATGPSTLAFDSVNNLLLVGNVTTSNLSVFQVNTTTGALTLTGTTSLGGSVNSIAVAKP